MKTLKPLLLALAVWAAPAPAAIELHQFETPAQEAIYKQLIDELRCLVCQNQNLADSNAELAQDLRRQTYEMVRAGKDRNEVVDYMVERYGDFVLYSPPLKGKTTLLWIGPFVFLAAAVVLLILIIRRKSRESTAGVVGDQDRQRAARLLDGDEPPKS